MAEPLHCFDCNAALGYIYSGGAPIGLVYCESCYEKEQEREREENDREED